MFKSDNDSGLSTDRITKAMKSNAPKSVMDFAGDQRRKVSDWTKQTRSKNGTINTQSTEEFGAFIK